VSWKSLYSFTEILAPADYIFCRNLSYFGGGA